MKAWQQFFGTTGTVGRHPRSQECPKLQHTLYGLPVGLRFFFSKKSGTQWVQGRLVQSQTISWNMVVPPDDTTLKHG